MKKDIVLDFIENEGDSDLEKRVIDYLKENDSEFTLIRIIAKMGHPLSGGFVTDEGINHIARNSYTKEDKKRLMLVIEVN